MLRAKFGPRLSSLSNNCLHLFLLWSLFWQYIIDFSNKHRFHSNRRLKSILRVREWERFAIFDNRSQHSIVEKREREGTTISYTKKRKKKKKKKKRERYECHSSKIFFAFSSNNQTHTHARTCSIQCHCSFKCRRRRLNRGEREKDTHIQQKI